MEVLLTTDDSELAKTSINFWNPITGTKLLTLRGPTANSHSLALIRNEGFLIIESGKPFIHFWQAGHSLQTSRRILCPGKPGSIAITPDASYLAVAIEEKIYIWQIATGRICSVINSAHYRPVTVLKFTDDGTHLISGGQDGMVLVWKLIVLVSGQSTIPIYSWTDHSLAVTDIHVGFGGSRATVFTASLDRTAKIYSLTTGSLLLSVSFPVQLKAIVADSAEFSFYVGTSTGVIYEIKLHSPPRSIEHHISSDAIADHVFKKHKDPITTLSISADGKTLASGDESGIVFLWDTESKQAIKTLGIKSKVTNLQFWLGNPEILKGGKKPSVIFPEVPKLVEQQTDDGRCEMDQVVMVWNRNKNSIKLNQDSISTNQSTSATTHKNTHNLDDSMAIQISKLKAELARSERINLRLHEFCVENILNEKDAKNAKDQNSEDESEQTTSPEKVSPLTTKKKKNKKIIQTVIKKKSTGGIVKLKSKKKK